MSRKISEILEDMDRLEEIEISDELINSIKDEFKDEIEQEIVPDEKVAIGTSDHVVIAAKDNQDHGKSDRI